MPRMTVLEKQLRQAFPHVGPSSITLAVRLMLGKVDNAELNELADDLIRQCYGKPSRTHATLWVLDRVLGTHGVEALGEVHMYDGPPFQYLNVGDASTATVVWHRSSGRYYVRSYGDIVEAYRL